MSGTKWICAQCGEPINRVDEAWLQTLVGGTSRVVHHLPASPVPGGCYGDTELESGGRSLSDHQRASMVAPMVQATQYRFTDVVTFDLFEGEPLVEEPIVLEHESGPELAYRVTMPDGAVVYAMPEQYPQAYSLWRGVDPSRRDLSGPIGYLVASVEQFRNGLPMELRDRLTPRG